MQKLDSILQSAGTKFLRRLAKLPLARKLPGVSWHHPVDARMWASTNAAGHVTSIREPYQAERPIPENVGSRDELPGLAPPWVKDFSLHDVPDLKVEGSFTVEVEDCWIVRTRYVWGGSEFCICTHDGQPLRFHGLVSDDSNAEMRAAFLKATKGKYEVLDEGTWVVGHWYNNYYHWFVEFLPRILLALELGLPEHSILLPPLFGQWAWDSVAMLNLAPHWLSEEHDAWRVGRLTLVSESIHHGPALKKVARRLAAGMTIPADKREKLWISRRDSQHRRLHHEAEIEAGLSERGWKIVQMSTMTLEEQVKTMGGAEAVAGLHGAGLTNILFAPPHTPVLEIVADKRPCAEYYALAACLEHPYWYVPAKSVGKTSSLVHDDVVVKKDTLDDAIDSLEQFLNRQNANLDNAANR